MTNPPGPTPGQPNPYEQGQPYAGQPIPPNPGQPAPGQPYSGQPYAAPPAAGQPYPVPSGPYPPAPQRRRNPVRKIIGGVVAAVVVVIAIVVVAAVFLGKDDGKSVAGSKEGMCLVISGSSYNAKSEKTDCGNQALNYIVGEKKDSGDCAKPYSKFSESGKDEVLCLVPNYRVGKCYKTATMSTLKEVPCTESSGVISTVVKVTQRVDSAIVPNCSDPKTQQHAVYDKPKPLGYCLEIQGDGYEFK